MNDRFRYRVWDKTQNKWLHFDFSTYPTYQDRIWQALTDGETFYQCTGLKDKNGKLIYEGDFLKDDENLLYEVTFKLQEYATSFSLKRREIPDYYPHITTWCGLGYRNCNKLEVIGNIYENKELLEEECQK